MRRATPRRVAVGALALLLVCVPAILADEPGQYDPSPEMRAISAAAAWRDSLEAVRVPAIPEPSASQSVIVVLRGPSVADAAPAGRATERNRIVAQQQRVETSLAGLGAVVNFRYRTLLDGLAIRAPAGALDAIAQLPEVAKIVPVTYLAPADTGTLPPPQPVPVGTATGGAGAPTGSAGSATGPSTGAAAPPAPATPSPPTAQPAHIALVDAGVDPAHPWLGGGIGPTYPIIGGADLVTGGPDPTATLTPPTVEAHGTAMAALVLRSPLLAGLTPDQAPRLLAYRVVAPEQVDGRVRPLARSDRVLAALDEAMDPNGDGTYADRPDVLLMGLARGFDGGAYDPVAHALSEAAKLGTVVVVPAGNDGPTGGPGGTVGSAASAPDILTVGGLTAPSAPRTAQLSVQTGPSQASLGPLPLMGAGPGGISAPLRFVPGGDGIASGNDPAQLRDAAGQSLVQGDIAVVSRGGGQLADKARNAAAAGAVAVAVWDQDGSGAFPGTAGGDDWPIPLVGLGRAQGRALWELASTQAGLIAQLTALPVAPATPQVAPFSSRGPTADGRLEPDLVAPATDLLTAFPGTAPDGRPLVTYLSGTSGAAAQVAAAALRLRIDHPQLDAADIRSVLVQDAQPVPGAGDVDQGAGALGALALPAVAIEPPILTARRLPGQPGRIRAVLHDLSGVAATYRLLLVSGAGDTVPLGAPVAVPAGARVGVDVPVPAGHGAYRARLVVVAGQDPTQAAVAAAPVFAAPAEPTPGAALGRPVVRRGGAGVAVTVRIGLLARIGDRIDSTPLHAVRTWLVPAVGGAPLALSGAKQPAAWAAGTYRLLLSGVLADGLPIPPGRYRVRVTARGPGGRALHADSAPVALP